MRLSTRIRARLLVRTTLVRTRSKYISLIGALACREGCRIATGGSVNFIARVEAANLPVHVMAAFAPLSESLRMLNRQEPRALRPGDRNRLPRGRARACIALAGKLAGILYAMWRDGTEFDPEALKHGVAAAAATA